VVLVVVLGIFSLILSFGVCFTNQLLPESVGKAHFIRSHVGVEILLKVLLIGTFSVSQGFNLFGQRNRLIGLL
jgi:hypothetical protein